MVLLSLRQTNALNLGWGSRKLSTPRTNGMRKVVIEEYDNNLSQKRVFSFKGL